MRSRIRIGGVSVLLTLLAATVAFATELSSVWSEDPVVSRGALGSPPSIPPDLVPAFRFQVLYGKILSRAKASEWRSELAGLASSQSPDPVSSAISDVARVWVARAEMEDIDALLLEYYSRNIRFPRTDADFQRILPATLAKDPWGHPWVYAPSAPRGFSSAMVGQRYQLSPGGMPGLRSLGESVTGRQPVKLVSAVSPRDIGGHRALEFRSPQSVSVIGPGGKAENCTLLYVGDHWALMSSGDRLFPVSF
jgi:hypothetical protein